MKRIIMPKASAALIDDALMELSNAVRLLEPLLAFGDLLVVQRTSQAMLKINRSIANLKEVPCTYKQERIAND